VRDNGAGFGAAADPARTDDLAFAPPHSLAERVQALKGDLRVSDGDCGAEIFISIPLPDPTP
jgi:hypothetical protein